MKIRLLMFALLAGSALAFGFLVLPVEAASSSVPCHECPVLYEECAAEADGNYAGCVASGSYTLAFCEAQRQDDLDACDMAEGSCYAGCFECENGGGEG